MNVKIPKVVTEEIDGAEFVRAARKLRPDSAPAFALDDLVEVVRDWGRKVPGVVIGISLRSGGWYYDCVTPRADGVLEAGSYSADKVTKLKA